MRATWIAALIVLTRVQPGAAQQSAGSSPVFRAEASLVSVNVSVKRGNRPLPGLTADAFQLSDDGVPQKITGLDFEAVPIDVTLVVDLSGSTAAIEDNIRQDSRRILAMLRPIDRGRVLAIHTAVQELLPLQPAGEAMKLTDRHVAPAGESSVRDAITAALIGRTDPDRRRLVVAITDGVDNKSLVEAETMYEVGRHSDAVLHLVLVTSPFGNVPFGPVRRDQMIDAADPRVLDRCHDPIGIPRGGAVARVDQDRLVGALTKSVALPPSTSTT